MYKQLPYILVFLLLVSAALCIQCQYPDKASQRTQIIQDSVWHMDSAQAYRLWQQHLQQEDSIWQQRDSLIEAYNDSVREAFQNSASRKMYIR